MSLLKLMSGSSAVFGYGRDVLLASSSFADWTLTSTDTTVTITVVAAAGGGTVTGSGAADRIAFWSGASALSSNSGFKFYTATGNMTIGGTAADAGVKLRVQASDGTAGIEMQRSQGAFATDAAILAWYRSRGDLTTPTSISAGDRLFEFDALGYQSTEPGNWGTAMMMECVADTGWGAGSTPGKWRMKLTRNGGSSTLDTRIEINSAGQTIHYYSDSTTNTIKDAFYLVNNVVGGSGAAGLGTAIYWDLENGAGTDKDAGRTAVYWEVATAGSERSAFSVQLMSGGAAMADALVVSHAGSAWTISDAATNTVTDWITVHHATSGAATTNYGTGLLFTGEDSGGATDSMARISATWRRSTAGSEGSEIRFDTVFNGTLTTFVAGVGYYDATTAYAMRVGAAYTFGAMADGVTVRTLALNAYTVTFTGTTANPTGSVISLGVGAITAADASGVTVGTGAGALIATPSSAAATGNVTFTDLSGIYLGSATTQGAAAAGSTYSGIQILAHTVTFGGATGITSTCGAAGIRIGTVTISDASAMTMTAAAALYIAAAPVGGGAGPVTITNSYAIWVDNDSARFDGRVLRNRGSVAAGGTLTLGTAGNVYGITGGATTINYITTTGWTAGSVIILKNEGSGTHTYAHNTAAPPGGTAALSCVSAANQSVTTSDVIMFFYDGTRWTQLAAVASLSL